MNSTAAPSWGQGVQPIPSDYDPSVDGSSLLFFSMPGCPWCTRIAPVMDTVARTLGSVVPVYKVGPDSPLTQIFGVTGFPTLIYFNEYGVPTKYDGERTADAIAAFVCNHTANRHSVCTKFYSLS